MNRVSRVGEPIKGTPMYGLRPIVLIVPLLLLLGAAAWSLVDLDGFFDATSAGNNWILQTFGSLYAWGVFAFVLTCAWVFVSPLGRVRIGGATATPLLSVWNWFSITLCTTIAIGILFWAMAEPVFHLYDSGARDIGDGPADRRQFALVSLFMHWAVSPYAIYTVAGLSFALAIHNFGSANSLAGPIEALIGRAVPALAAQALDALILISLILGMAASLGAGMLLLAGGLGKLAGVSTSPWLLAVIAFAIVGVVLVSSISGLLRGIRILSDINTKFFFAFVAFVFVFGPTLAIGEALFSGLVGYAQEFLPRSLLFGIGSDRNWAYAWTIFYWANWLAWAPVTAMFLGRIARGYTVRAFICMNLILPAAFSIVWMSVFGVFAAETDQALGGGLKAVLDNSGPEAVAFEAISVLPLGGVLIALLIGLSFISYVTAADSNTEAIRMITIGEPPSSVASSQERPRSHIGVGLKIVWVCLLGATAWTMTAYSGIEGVRMLSNLGGLPALFVVLTLNVALLKWTFGSSLRALQSDFGQAAISPNVDAKASISS